MTKFTALDKIAESCTISNMTASKRRNRSEAPIKNTTQEYHLGYDEGCAAAYNDAHFIMKNELRRLQNLFQNGALSVEDFQ